MSTMMRRSSMLLLLGLVALLVVACGAPTAVPETSASAAGATAAASASAAASDTSSTASEEATADTSTAPNSDATAVASAAADTTATSEASPPGSEETAEATIPPAEETTTATAGTDATPAIVAAANAFLDTLSDTERQSVLFDWTDTEQKQRWSNLPEGLYERAGLMWGDMSEEQHNAWLALMQATLSTDGYNQVVAEWNADAALAGAEDSGSVGGGGSPPAAGSSPGADSSPAAGPGGSGGPGGQLLYGTEYYWVALIGEPSETEPWQWQWGGHHVTVNATIVGSDIALTPSFIGVQPGEYTDDAGNTVTPLGPIEEDAFALVNALDATQQQSAILGDTVIDLVLGPGQDGKTIASEGLPASEMTEEQQAILLELIDHYTGLANDEDAVARLAEVASTLDETYFAWYGPTTEGSAAYFRVTGPTIVIEFSAQGGGGTGTGLGGAATLDHIHGVYRDPTNDYGATYTGITIESSTN